MRMVENGVTRSEEKKRRKVEGKTNKSLHRFIWLTLMQAHRLPFTIEFFVYPGSPGTLSNDLRGLFSQTLRSFRPKNSYISDSTSPSLEIPTRRTIKRVLKVFVDNTKWPVKYATLWTASRGVLSKVGQEVLVTISRWLFGLIGTFQEDCFQKCLPFRFENVYGQFELPKVSVCGKWGHKHPPCGKWRHKQ